jgi:hypothetical protein
MILYLLGGLFLGLVCLPSAPARADEPAQADTTKSDTAKQDLYLPEIVRYLQQYAPVYTQAEEPEWMNVPGFHAFFSPVPASPMTIQRSVETNVCLEEAFKGNPRGMVCVATRLPDSAAPGQQHIFPANLHIPAAAYTAAYWFAWAAKYMPPGWVETRIGDYGTANELHYPEAGYLATRQGATTSEALLYAANAGWPDALGVAAHYLASGGGYPRVLPQEHCQGP